MMNFFLMVIAHQQIGSKSNLFFAFGGYACHSYFVIFEITLLSLNEKEKASTEGFVRIKEYQF